VISEKNLEKEIDKLSGLKEMKGKSKEFLAEKAQENLAQKEADHNIVRRFKDKKEKKIAKELIHKYLETYTIESISEMNALNELICYEVIQHRLQEQMNEHYDDNNAIPHGILDSMHKNSEMVMELKNSLGLHQEKKESEYNVIEKLKKRFKHWRQENQGSRTLLCPFCAKTIMLKIRMEAWEAQKHPFFKDRLVYNQHLFRMYKAGTITKDDIAKVLETSPDYIGWVLTKVKTVED